MTQDSNAPTLLVEVATEMEAAAIVSALEAAGIAANHTGGHTAGFRAEAPGAVQVWVHEWTLQKAHEILEKNRQQEAAVDWSSVDVGEPLDN